MNTLFPLILVMLTLLCLVIVLLDKLCLRRPREASGKRVPWWIDYARSFLPILIIVLVIRSFVFQIYRVPTGSLTPTVIPGDFIFVRQYAYGLRLPITHTKILSIGMPKRGDIALFRWPADPAINYVKRIVGLPGDHIIYKNRVLTINGKEMTQKILGTMPYEYPNDIHFTAQIRRENLDGVEHDIIIDPSRPEDSGQTLDFTVPKGYYFAMGDNRDDSSDSRMWGFVPATAFIGRATRVIFSWNVLTHRPRWSRIGDKL